MSVEDLEFTLELFVDEALEYASIINQETFESNVGLEDKVLLLRLANKLHNGASWAMKNKLGYESPRKKQWVKHAVIASKLLTRYTTLDKTQAMLVATCCCKHKTDEEKMFLVFNIPGEQVKKAFDPS